MFGFVLLPEKRVTDECVRLSGELSGSRVKLDGSVALPHVTVLQAPIRGDFDWRGSLRKFRDFRGFVNEPRSVVGGLVWADKFMFLGVENVSWLADFNRLIVNDVSAFVDVPDKPDGFETWSDVEQDSFLKTGYRRNLGAFYPHVTLGFFGNDVERQGVSLPVSGLTGSRFRFKSLAFVEHGEHGVIKKVLGEELLPFSWD